MVLKSCSGDLRNMKHETVFQLIPMTTEAWQIRALVLNADECIGTFINPQIEVWQQVGLRRCALNAFSTADVRVLWAIGSEIRPARIVTPLSN